jgi:hypothetical protein
MAASHRLTPVLARAAFVTAVALAVFYVAFLRPSHMRWGASNVEVATPLPGDRVIGNATFVATRALTIDAPPDVVWPQIQAMGVAEGRFVKGFEANRYLLWVTRSVPRLSWCWALSALPGSRTRLVTRVRFHHNWLSPAVFRVLAADIGDIYTVRAAMERVKAGAEATARKGQRSSSWARDASKPFASALW